MSSLQKIVNKKVLSLLAIFILLLVLLSLLFYLYDVDSTADLDKNISALGEFSIDDQDPFYLGQYYFNHDDDPAGPYDLVLAREYFEKAISEDPEGHPLQWYQLARIDFIEGKFHAALYRLDKQIEYFGDSVPNVYYMVGLTNGYKARRGGDQEDWEKGAEGFEKYLEYDQGSPWARTDLSWIYFAQGKYKEMIPVLEEGLLFHPEHAWLLNMYGLALMNTNRRDEAKEQFLKARVSASKLTVTDWGKAYPGNNPEDWTQGLKEFQGAIEKNLALLVGE